MCCRGHVRTGPAGMYAFLTSSLKYILGLGTCAYSHVDLCIPSCGPTCARVRSHVDWDRGILRNASGIYVLGYHRCCPLKRAVQKIFVYINAPSLFVACELFFKLEGIGCSTYVYDSEMPVEKESPLHVLDHFYVSTRLALHQTSICSLRKSAPARTRRGRHPSGTEPRRRDVERR